ncbi:hypothetical protein U9K52_05320 [Chryseobacterium sp. MHB01]|uniref:hypothetical protein n=1 Tax=Chryseobacterium sp. MHB01 TaxID=3109433 RepID=UPI002AFEFFEE|nr:hypothetical protein [Chryseobacterium sp. MHB01]MEA1848331.1 hypothetical protein [Chryseobacterium sp. MHB01]
MKKQLYIFLLPVLFLQSCSFLEQNNFIETKIISSDLNEKIVYKFYQTGLHDYKVDFYSVDKSGSTKLFEHDLDDAFTTFETYTISENDDELIIRTKLFCEVKKLVTRNGKSIVLTNR